MSNANGSANAAGATAGVAPPPPSSAAPVNGGGSGAGGSGAVSFVAGTSDGGGAAAATGNSKPVGDGTNTAYVQLVGGKSKRRNPNAPSTGGNPLMGGSGPEPTKLGLGVRKSLQKPSRGNFLEHKIDEAANANRPIFDPKNNNKPDRTLQVDDITGGPVRAPRTNRVTNPVAPVYELASYQARAFTPPKPALRDTLSVDDIDGARTKQRWNNSDERKGFTEKYDDMKGNKPKPLTRTRKGYHPPALNVDDITKNTFKSTRVTNPLSPRYQYGRPTNFDLSTHLQLSAGSLVTFPYPLLPGTGTGNAAAAATATASAAPSQPAAGLQASASAGVIGSNKARAGASSIVFNDSPAQSGSAAAAAASASESKQPEPVAAVATAGGPAVPLLIGDMDRNHPPAAKRTRPKHHQFNLRTDDIREPKPKLHTKALRDTNITNDIPGAQAGTKPHILHRHKIDTATSAKPTIERRVKTVRPWSGPGRRPVTEIVAATGKAVNSSAAATAATTLPPVRASTAIAAGTVATPAAASNSNTAAAPATVSAALAPIAQPAVDSVTVARVPTPKAAPAPAAAAAPEAATTTGAAAAATASAVVAVPYVPGQTRTGLQHHVSDPTKAPTVVAHVNPRHKHSQANGTGGLIGTSPITGHTLQSNKPARLLAPAHAFDGSATGGGGGAASSGVPRPASLVSTRTKMASGAPSPLAQKQARSLAASVASANIAPPGFHAVATHLSRSAADGGAKDPLTKEQSIKFHTTTRNSAQLELFSGRGLRAKAEATQQRAAAHADQRRQDIDLVRSLKF